jgi:predicted ATP-grasp superfamily ATP-dependent carboligase
MITLDTSVSVKPKATMVAGFQGPGFLGATATRYLLNSLHAVSFAAVDISDCLYPDGIHFIDGIAQPPTGPVCFLYYSMEKNVVVLVSNAMGGGVGANAIADRVLQAAKTLDIQRIILLSSYLHDMHSNQATQIFAAAGNKKILDAMIQASALSAGTSQLKGIEGLLLGKCAADGLDAACLMATMPHYFMETYYPKAAIAQLQILEKILALKIESAALIKMTAEFDLVLAEIERRFEKIAEIIKADDELQDLEDEEVPGHIIQRIERLFIEAEVDKSQAKRLRDELTRWGLFDLYEDRFLDLFSKP